MRRLRTGAAFLLLLLAGAAAVWFATGGISLGTSEQTSNAPPPEPTGVAAPAPADQPRIQLFVGQRGYRVGSEGSVHIRVPNDSHAVDVFVEPQGSGALLWTTGSTRQYVPNHGTAEITCTGSRMEYSNENGVPTMRSVACPAVFSVRVEAEKP